MRRGRIHGGESDPPSPDPPPLVRMGRYLGRLPFWDEHNVVRPRGLLRIRWSD